MIQVMRSWFSEWYKNYCMLMIFIMLALPDPYGSRPIFSQYLSAMFFLLSSYSLAPGLSFKTTLMLSQHSHDVWRTLWHQQFYVHVYAAKKCLINIILIIGYWMRILKGVVSSYLFPDWKKSGSREVQKWP